MIIQTQAIGIDISAADFTGCLCQKSDDRTLSFTAASSSFRQTKTGFNQLLRWANSHADPGTELVFVMEASGVYYERLAHYLHGVGKTVHVVLPNKSNHYAKSLNVKTKTDRVDARVLARMGVERQLTCWEPVSPLLVQLRNLTRYHVQLQEQKTALGNMHHSKKAAHQVQSFILQSNKTLIRQIDKQIQRCRQQIIELVASDAELAERIAQLCTIKGVGILTVAAVVAETGGFQRTQNTRQLASYAGYDVIHRESGTSVKGKTRISKKGNRYIRHALYYPAMVASRYNPDLREAYLRINQNKPSKMIGQVAIQRKLLVLMYTLWKNRCAYQPGYHKKIAPTARAEATQDSSAAA